MEKFKNLTIKVEKEKIEEVMELIDVCYYEEETGKDVAYLLTEQGVVIKIILN